MTKAEAAIGARIKEFRERIEWPQSGFAYEVDVTRNKLAGIEYGRTPLRYGLALRICKRYGVSRLWLARGVGSMQPHWEVGQEIESSIPAKMLLSEAFQRFLEPAIPKPVLSLLNYNAVTGATELVLTPSGVPPGRQHEWYVMKAFREAINRIPTGERTAFCDGVLSAIGRLFATHAKHDQSQVALKASAANYAEAITRAAKEGRLSKTKQLTDAETPLRVAEVKSLPELLERLKKATAEPGKKTELAAFLKRVTKANVPLASVSRWLSGEREPGGEVALQLDAWATAQGFPKAK